jgi:hypothetical protein
MDMASAVGTPLTWTTAAGKKYQVAEHNIDFATAFQRYLEQSELDGLRRHAEALGGDYGRALDNWQKGLGAGLYEWGGEWANKAFYQPHGYKYAAALSIAEGSGISVDAALEVVEAAFEDESPAGLAAWKELQAVQTALNDPNRKRLLKQAAAAATSTPANPASV